PPMPCPTNRPAPARPRRAAAGAAALVLLALAGCQRDDEVRHYTAPRAEAPPPEDDAGPGRQRLLGAVVGRGEQKWFVQVTGPEAAVGGHEKEFDDFVATFRFPAAGGRPEWKAPDGWRKGPPVPFSVASFRLGEGDDAPQLTVSQVGGSVLENVNRWR